MKRLLLGVILLVGGCKPKLCSIDGAWNHTGSAKQVSLVFADGMVSLDDGSGKVYGGSYSAGTYDDEGTWQIHVSGDRFGSLADAYYTALCDESGQALSLEAERYSSDDCSLDGVLVRQSTVPQEGIVCGPDGSGCSCSKALVTESPSACDQNHPGGAVCCADYSWPSSGGCGCNAILCDTDGSAPEVCFCRPTTTGTPTTTACLLATICCYSSEYNWCRCYSGNTVCGTGYTKVTSCTSASYKCSSGQTSVTTCSGN